MKMKSYSSLKSQDYYASLLSLPEVRAALDMIAYSEGLQANPFTGAKISRANSFSTGYNYNPINNLDWHPQTVWSGTPNSSASGRFQFMQDTWNEIAPALGLQDFSPRSQEIAALARIDQRHGLEPLLAGDVKGFVNATAKEWASFPGANYPGQSMKGMPDLVSRFNDALAAHRQNPENIDKIGANTIPSLGIDGVNPSTPNTAYTQAGPVGYPSFKADYQEQPAITPPAAPSINQQKTEITPEVYTGQYPPNATMAPMTPDIPNTVEDMESIFGGKMAPSPEFDLDESNKNFAALQDKYDYLPDVHSNFNTPSGKAAPGVFGQQNPGMTAEVMNGIPGPIAPDVKGPAIDPASAYGDLARSFAQVNEFDRPSNLSGMMAPPQTAATTNAGLPPIDDQPLTSTVQPGHEVPTPDFLAPAVQDPQPSNRADILGAVLGGLAGGAKNVGQSFAGQDNSFFGPSGVFGNPATGFFGNYEAPAGGYYGPGIGVFGLGYSQHADHGGMNGGGWHDNAGGYV